MKDEPGFTAAERAQINAGAKNLIAAAAAGDLGRWAADMTPVEVDDEVAEERSSALAQAAASLKVEGLTPSADAAAITERWARGEISTAQMRAAVRKLHGIG
jgi:hypothetical protein